MKAVNMLVRTAVKALADTRISAFAVPPIFLLPNRARYFNSTAQIIDSPIDSFYGTQGLPSSNNEAAISNTSSTSAVSASTPASTSQPDSATQTPKPLSDSIKTLLPLLYAQPSHYITAHIHAKPYLLTTGDTVRLPFHMPGVAAGDVLRLTRASAIGSRDYTLKGTPYVDERLFECRATVMGTEGEPVRVKEKTKRRNRRVKTVRSKHKFTILKVKELRLKDLNEVQDV